MQKKIVFDLKEKIGIIGSNINTTSAATLILKWLHNYPSLQKEFLDHSIDISIFFNIGISDISNYPIKKSLISFYDLEALKQQIDISTKRNTANIYQLIYKLLENLFIIQKPDMECNICHGTYGFDLWKETYTNRLVYCCKTCEFSEYVDGEVRSDASQLSIPTNDDLSSLYPELIE